ncbi:DUF2510 domain-containing protein [Streptomyces chiangmaiensis]|uniref:DUF2510 domain-containing protein n=1 Tax=Streptomyces chiangmaiensis TaxID=766497 RepID=A0ABU7FS71_9ACTN|nr:DUF2510 domain-containing protein [Streptomyces chiangmaiensis]MED7825969.1 DUF2510 domain-containing protein [Streptomyces chiangmaiensis]
MSSAPPPGWYRDPSYPLTERWWDGAAWTDHRRQPEVPVPPSPQPPDRRGPRRAGGVALGTAGALLVAAIVTGAVVAENDGGGAAQTKSSSTAATSASASDASPPAPATSAMGDPNVVLDELNGITFPVPGGWTRAENVAEDDVVLTTPGVYDCPGDPGFCRHGRVLSRTATSAPGASPESIAKGDIANAAHEEYDRDRLGRRPFGGVTSHRLLASGQVAVAGRAGYFVRWRVDTAKGPGGYVESLAFPSSTGSQAPVVVRFAFDAGPDGPPLSDMDRITNGIRPVGDAATSGGVGSSIGPGG